MGELWGVPTWGAVVGVFAALLVLAGAVLGCMGACDGLVGRACGLCCAALSQASPGASSRSRRALEAAAAAPGGLEGLIREGTRRQQGTLGVGADRLVLLRARGRRERPAACVEQWALPEHSVEPPRRSDAVDMGVQGADVAAVACGARHALALLPSGEVRGWGAAEGEAVMRAPRYPSEARGPFVAISAGASTSAAIRADGVAEFWGDNTLGQTPMELLEPPGYERGSRWVQVSCGYDHTLLLDSNGRVHCLGDDLHGQAPSEGVSCDQPFTCIAAGGSHSCGVLEDGQVVCWGSSEHGQAPADSVLGAILGGQRCTVVAAGLGHSAALTEKGEVALWGSNAAGQAPLGLHAPKEKGVRYASVACGARFSAAVTTDGTVKVWGVPGMELAKYALPPPQAVAQPTDESVTIDVDAKEDGGDGKLLAPGRRTSEMK